MYWRYLEGELRKWLVKPYVQILFGARQTGKTTLLRKVCHEAALWIDLADPAERSRYLSRPGTLIDECLALKKSETPHLIVIDEAQSVPSIFDAVQYLYDKEKTRWLFVLCGSSARKLRKTGANLLPGRAVYHHLYTLMASERPFPPSIAVQHEKPHSVIPSFSLPDDVLKEMLFPETDIITRLAFGELPGIAVATEDERARLLKSYALIYLEEEIRREGLVKDWGAFVRFLQLVAAESGGITNFMGISKEAGISVPTVKSYYQLLEDMFIGFRVPAFSKSARKYLLSTPKFYFFDTGVRHAAAGLTPDRQLVHAAPGRIFEQWVGTELWKRIGYTQQGTLYHYRTKGGAEIDFIVETDNRLIPVEVKWTELPTEKDARHIIEFIKDHPDKAKDGYIVCRCLRPMQIYEKITAIPYWAI